MKQIFLYLWFILISLTLFSCDIATENSITFLNYAADDVYVNFMGDLTHITPNAPPNEEGILHIPPGDKVELTKVFKGEYEYETIYEIPAGATGGTSEGDMSGTFILKSGTKILVVYTSTFSDSSYTIFASVTTSDDQSTEFVNPIGP